MLDGYGRNIDYLRVSVTDRCNLRCRYCMPEEGIGDLGHSRILTLEEVHRLIQVAAGVGFKKVRFTGGEPLVRRNLAELIRNTADIAEIEDISMTTNGILFADMAEELKQAGLTRINISLDTLVEEKFKYITRRGKLADVEKSIQKALELNMDPVKINMVVMKGFNDNEILDFVDLTYRYPLHVRFIEFMPIGNLPFHKQERVMSIEDIQNIIKQEYVLIPAEKIQGSGPARYCQLEGGQGSIGFISPLSQHFCASCNRIRLTADGKLRSCLYHTREVDLKLAVQNGLGNEQLAQLFKKAIRSKPGRHEMNNGWGIENERKMFQIGG